MASLLSCLFVSNMAEQSGASSGVPPSDGDVVDEFPVQVEDVNGDVVDFDPTQWKKIVDETPLELDEEEEEEQVVVGGGAGAAAEVAEQPEENDNEPPEGGEEIVVERDDSAQTLNGHGGDPVYSIAVNPKLPNVVCSGGGDDNAVLWDVMSGEQQFRLTGHTDSVTAVEFSKSGPFSVRVLLTVGSVGRLGVVVD